MRNDDNRPLNDLFNHLAEIFSVNKVVNVMDIPEHRELDKERLLYIYETLDSVYESLNSYRPMSIAGRDAHREFLERLGYALAMLKHETDSM